VCDRRRDPAGGALRRGVPGSRDDPRRAAGSAGARGARC